jgi:type VI secretion system protein VasJ
LNIAHVCRQAGRHELARALLEALDQQGRHHDLERWEPDLALAIAHQLHGCYEQLGLRERKEELYRRLCRLDLDAALN